LFIAVKKCVDIRVDQIDLTYFRKEIIIKLLTHKVYINSKNCVNISLAIAIFSDSIAIVKFLLKQNIDIDESDRTDFTLLQLLYRYYISDRVKRKLCILDFFLKYKVNSNRKISRENTLFIEIC